MSIMRIKKGSKVEVFNKKDAPSGSWHGAEVICGNGRYYDVKYDSSSSTVCEEIVEKVNRKAIRPCPPFVEGAENWVPGDIAEVFDNVSWKIATVLKVIRDNYFLVRVVGSSRELRLCKSYLRVRQSWQNDEWIVVGKGSRNWEVERCNNFSTSKYDQKSSPQVPQTDTKMKLCVEDDFFPVQNDIGFLESHIVSSRKLKRGSTYCLSNAEAYTGAGRKMQAVEKEGRHQRMVPWNPSPLPEKVDAVASPREIPGEKYTHASFNNKTTGFFEMDMERRKSNGDVGCSRSSESNDGESSASSVGSCSSTSDGPYRLPHQSFTKPIQGQGWRLVHLASKGLKMMAGFATLSWCRQWGKVDFNSQDSLLWPHDSKGKFIVKSMLDSIIVHSTGDFPYNAVWSSFIPSKVCFFPLDCS